ncbi:MAG TPA: selenium-dependent molybdenum cofactor biosynthesis protein YqeB [Anaerolineales bacterium]
MPATILIRGAGDLASGVAVRLHRSGLNVVMTELATPFAVRRSVSFSEAIYEGQVQVEGIAGSRVKDPADTLKIRNVLAAHNIAVLLDPDCMAAAALHPLVIVDGRMTKRAPEPFRHSAAMYIGLGPGFLAPTNCHAVIETQRGHRMGRVIFNGAASDDNHQPDGDPRRVLRAPKDGLLESDSQIGQHFEPKQVVATVAGTPILAPFAGILRGLIRPGVRVVRDMKIGDVDARDDPELCRLVSDKSLAVGGGVLEAMLSRAEVQAKLWA